MRKKWTYVAIVSMMLGVAPVFTGCVDTDEPAGIEQLRGAKAELLKAKAAVEEARVAVIQAEADLKAAEAESKRAFVKWQEEMARKQQIENDMQQAENEMELQLLQAKLDSAQTAIAHWKELATIQHEKKMAVWKEAAAKAQYSYEVALKQIEVAKALGVAYEEASLKTLEENLKTAYKALYGDPESPDAGYGLAEELRDKNEELYNAQLDKDAGIIADKDGASEEFVAKLEAKIALEEARLAGKEQELADLEKVAELDIEGTDWDTEIKTLEEEANKLQAQLNEKTAEKKRLQADPDYLTLYQAVNGLYDKYTENDPLKPDNGATVLKKGTKTLLEEAQTALKTAANSGKPSFNIAEYKSSKPVTTLISQAVGDKDGDNVLDLPEGTITIPAKKNFLWGNDGVATKNPDEAVKTYAEYDKYLKMLKPAEIDENEVAQAEAELKDKQDAEATAKDAYDDAYDAWERVKNIVAAEEDYQVDITAFQTLANDYNDAYGKLQEAIDAYNEDLQAAYTNAYNVEYNKKVLEFKISALTGNGENSTIYKSRIDAIQGFGAAGANAVVTSWNSPATNKTEETLSMLILANCTPYTDSTSGTQVTAASIQGDVLEQLNGYVDQQTHAGSWDATEANLVNLAKAAAQTWSNTQDAIDLRGTIEEEKGKVKDQYDKVVEGIGEFKKRAETFAQVVDDKVFNEDYLMSALNDKDEPTTVDADNWYVAGTGDNVIGTTAAKYVINNSEITPDELKTATVTTFEASLETTAMIAVAKAAFGVDEVRYAPVSLEKAPGGKAKAYYDAIQATKQTEAKIAAQEDLKLLITELETSKAAVQADLASQYQKVFATELANLETAKENHKVAQAALDEANEQFTELDLEIGKLSAQVAGKVNVSNTLEGFINQYLTDNGANFQYDPDTFEAKIAEEIAKKREEVAGAEEMVAKAEIELKKAQDGKYDRVDYLTWELSIIQERYDAAMEKYTKAQEDLAKYMEIMAASDSSEQPAE